MCKDDTKPRRSQHLPKDNMFSNRSSSNSSRDKRRRVIDEAPNKD